MTPQTQPGGHADQLFICYYLCEYSSQTLNLRMKDTRRVLLKKKLVTCTYVFSKSSSSNVAVLLKMYVATRTRTISRYVPWAHVYNLLLEFLEHQIRVVRGIPLLEAMASATEFRMLRIMILVSKYAYGIDLTGVDLLLGGMARFHATRQ